MCPLLLRQIKQQAHWLGTIQVIRKMMLILIMDLLEVATWHRPVVEDYDDIFAVQGLQFALTNSQVYALNDMLKAHFEDQKVNELKGVAA